MREASIPCPLLSHGYYQSKWRWTKIQKKNCGSSRRTGDEWKRKMVRARARSRSHNRNNDNSLNFLFFLFILLAFLLIKCEEFNWFEVVEFYELADCCWERERDSDWNVLQMQRDPFSIYPPFTRNSKWANAHAHRTSYRHFSHIKLLSWVPPNAGQLNGQTNAFIAWHALECAPRWLLEWQQNS